MVRNRAFVAVALAGAALLLVGWWSAGTVLYVAGVVVVAIAAVLGSSGRVERKWPIALLAAAVAAAAVAAPLVALRVQNRPSGLQWSSPFVGRPMVRIGDEVAVAGEDSTQLLSLLDGHVAATIPGVTVYSRAMYDAAGNLLVSGSFADWSLYDPSGRRLWSGKVADDGAARIEPLAASRKTVVFQVCGPTGCTTTAYGLDGRHRWQRSRPLSRGPVGHDIVDRRESPVHAAPEVRPASLPAAAPVAGANDSWSFVDPDSGRELRHVDGAEYAGVVGDRLVSLSNTPSSRVLTVTGPDGTGPRSWALTGAILPIVAVGQRLLVGSSVFDLSGPGDTRPGQVSADLHPSTDCTQSETAGAGGLACAEDHRVSGRGWDGASAWTVSTTSADPGFDVDASTVVIVDHVADDNPFESTVPRVSEHQNLFDGPYVVTVTDIADGHVVAHARVDRFRWGSDSRVPVPGGVVIGTDRGVELLGAPYRSAD